MRDAAGPASAEREVQPSMTHSSISRSRAPRRPLPSPLTAVTRPVLFVLGVLTALLALSSGAFAADPAADPAPALPRTHRPAKARVYFITPKNGEKLKSPVVVRFGLEQMGVAPAGVDKPDTGHHHLIVDAELPPPSLPVPKSDHYLHFGGGQTETSLELAPGKHTLQLLLADQNHVPHDPPVVSERITIEVVK
jgi:hypothetical protein